MILLTIFYMTLVKEMDESEGEGSILGMILKVSWVDTFSGYPSCLVAWLFFRRRVVRKVVKFCRVLE
jgi:hypothetical protein